MKVLVIGAGVLGSLYAGRLQASGHEVVLLARGERLEQIRSQGLNLVDHKSGSSSVTMIQVVDRISQNENFELAIVFVRKNQLHDLIPTMASSKNIPNILFMVNNVSGIEEYCQAIGKERVLLGFPGAGGYRDPSGKVTYSILPAILTGNSNWRVGWSYITTSVENCRDVSRIWFSYRNSKEYGCLVENTCCPGQPDCKCHLSCRW